MKFSYPAVFKQREDGGYRVHFPDLEMCTAEGNDFEDALECAREAESIWIQVELEDEMCLPAVSFAEDYELDEGEFFQSVTVNVKLVDGYDE